MDDLIDAIRELSDTQVMRLLRAVFDEAYARIPIAEVRDRASDIPEVSSWVGLAPETLTKDLSAEASAEMGRTVLVHYAKNPRLAPFVTLARAKAEASDEMFVTELLTVGLLVNLTLLVCTTTGEARVDEDGNATWRVEKKEVSPGLLKSLIEPVSKVVAKVSGG